MFSYANFIVRFRWLIIAVSAVVFLLIASGIPKLKVNTSLDKWFMDGDPLKEATRKFEEIFGNDQFAGILAQSDNMLTKDNLKLVTELGQDLKNNVPFVDEVYSITENEITTVDADGTISVRKLLGDNLPETQQELEIVRKRAFSDENFYSRLITKDGKQSMIAVSFMPFPEKWLDDKGQIASVAAGEQISTIIKKDKYKPLNLNATGLPVVNYQILSTIQKETKIITLASLLISIIASIILLRSLRGVVITFTCSILSILIMLGIMGHSGINVESTFLTMPILLGIATSICYSVHIVTFFRNKFRSSGDRKEAVIFSIQETGKAVIFSYLTTVVALLTFLFVKIEFVRFVGLSSALVTTIVFVLILMLMPAILSIGKNIPKEKVVEKEDAFGFMFENLSNWVINHSKPILASFAILVVIMIYGITRIEVSTDWERTYGRKLEGVNMALNVAQSELGALFSYEVMIELPQNGDAKKANYLKKLDMLTTKIEKYDHTKRANSICSYIKNFNKVLNNNDKKFEVIPNEENEIAQLLYLYETAGGSEIENWVDYEYKYLRLNVETDYFNTDQIRNNINQIQKEAEQAFPGSKVSIIGSLPQALKLQDYLVSGQIESFAYSLITILILMVWVFKSIKVGIIALIPNVAPTIFVGGLMGFMKIPLDMVTVTLIPMLLGLAVDDTIHFIMHSQEEFKKRRNYKLSVNHVFRTVGVAIFSTTLILALNFSVNMVSSVKMLFNMGFMSAVGITSALLADFFVTSILLRNYKAFGEETNPDTPVSEEIPNEIEAQYIEQ